MHTAAASKESAATRPRTASASWSLLRSAATPSASFSNSDMRAMSSFCLSRSEELSSVNRTTLSPRTGHTARHTTPSVVADLPAPATHLFCCAAASDARAVISVFMAARS